MEQKSHDVKCEVCGGRKSACAALGHRPDKDRGVLWHPDDLARVPPADRDVNRLNAHDPGNAAMRTLMRLGYTHNGGIEWRPPFGREHALLRALRRLLAAFPKGNANQHGADCACAYHEAMKTLAAYRTEEAVPSVASGVEKNGAIADAVKALDDALRPVWGAVDGHTKYASICKMERLQSLLAAPVAALAAREQEASNWLWRHKKSGGLYRLIGSAQLQTDKPLNDLSEVEVYQSEDGRLLWVRDAAEFRERFERAQPLASRQEAPAASAHDSQRAKMISEALVKLDGLYADLCDESPERPDWLRAALRVARGEQLGVAVNTAPAAALSPATVAQPVTVADRVVRMVGEMDDRTSPEDWPEAMLVTGEELHAFILLAFEQEAEAAQHCASQGCGGDGGETLHALRWCAAALQALVDSRGESGSISMIVSGEKKSLEEVLDMADAALSTDKGDGGSRE